MVASAGWRAGARFSPCLGARETRSRRSLYRLALAAVVLGSTGSPISVQGAGPSVIELHAVETLGIGASGYFSNTSGRVSVANWPNTTRCNGRRDHGAHDEVETAWMMHGRRPVSTNILSSNTEIHI